MPNLVTTIFDVEDRGLSRGLKTAITNVKEAEGATGKLKAGFSGLGQVMRDNVAAAALAAGTAIVGFGIKAAGAFQSTAVEAGKFAEAAGISVEAASRWMEVAGDVGVEAGAVEAALRKMNQGIAAGKPVFDEYADSIVRGADGMVDADATFQNLISTIGAIEDPTKRAKAAQDAFGRGYAEMAELMGMSAAELKDALASVSDQKIIDEGELAKARDARARMDELKDTFEDVELAVGEFVVSMSPAITKVAQIAKGILGLTGAVSDFLFAAKPASEQATDWWESIADPSALSRGQVVTGFLDRFNERLDNKSLLDKSKLGLEAYRRELFDFGEQTTGADMRFREFKATFEELAEVSPETAEQLLTDMGKLRTGTDDAAVGFQEWAEFAGLTDERMLELAKSIPATAKASDDAAGSARDLGTDLADLDKQAYLAEKALDDAKDAANELGTAYDTLMGKLDEREAYANAQEAVGELMETMADAESSWGDLSSAADDATRAYADFVMGTDEIPDEVKTILIAELDAGNLDKVRAFIDAVMKGFDMPIYPKLVGGAGVSGATGGQLPSLPKFDSGGVMPGPRGQHSLAWVAGGETVLPTHKPGAVTADAPVIINVDARGAVGLSGPQVEQWIHEAWTAARRKRGKST
jgi:methyl-accepting chemotaxis protein